MRLMSSYSNVNLANYSVDYCAIDSCKQIAAIIKVTEVLWR